MDPYTALRTLSRLGDALDEDPELEQKIRDSMGRSWTRHISDVPSEEELSDDPTEDASTGSVSREEFEEMSQSNRMEFVRGGGEIASEEGEATEGDSPSPEGDQITREKFDDLSQGERAEFVRGGGEVVEA